MLGHGFFSCCELLENGFGGAEMDTKHAQGTKDVLKDTTLQVQLIACMLLAPYLKVQGPECQLACLLGNTHTHLVYIKVDVP